MSKSTILTFTVSFGLLCFAAANAYAAPGAEPYKPTNTFRVGAEGRWDYVTVDSDHRLLYVTRTTHTMVIDASTGKTVADIPGQKGNHGVALVPKAGRGFITDGKDGSVVIFDLKTNAVLGTVKTADDADGIIYDPASNKVIMSCGDANALVTISPDVDPKTGKADAPIELGGKPEFLAADGNGKVYVCLEDKDEVAVVDTKTMKATAKWPTAPGGVPVGMALDAANHRLFVGCRNPQKLIVMNADDGKVLADFPIGAGCDSTKFDDGFIFSSCGDGTMTVVREADPQKFDVVQTVTTRQGAKTMAVDPQTHEVFLPTAEFEPAAGTRNRPVAKPDTFMILVFGRS